MAKDIISLIPADAKTYLEPFAGSLAVLLRKEPHKCEVVNDLDNRLVSFWRVLRDKPDDLQRALTFTPYARAEFEHVLSVIDAPCDDVEFARRVFIILRQSRKRSTSATPGNFRASGDAPAGPGRVFCSSVDTLIEVSSRLRHVVVENSDALDLIRRWDSTDTVMYLDPPYVGETRTARDYTVENAGVDFHNRLVEIVSQSKARIILSGYDHHAYSPLSDWNKRTTQSQTGAVSKTGQYATETLWTNF